MKKGDLVKLVLPAGVMVYWVFDDQGRPMGDGLPEGTVAVFLAFGALGAPIASILIEGRVGWAWSRYLEVIDEAG